MRKIVGVLGVVGVVAGCSNQDSQESLREKQEWAILQAAESSHRNTAISEPIFETDDQYELMSVRGFNGQNIWIMLHPNSPPYYKQMPQGNYVVPQALVDKLVREKQVSYTVEQVLKSHTPS